MSHQQPLQIVPNRAGAGAVKRNEQMEDLAGLVTISDEAIVACLRDRYLLDILYTSLGPSSLVAINPHKFVNINSDQVLGSYGHDYRNTEETRDHLPPHIFGIAGKAYFDMRRTGRDQSILMSGESGSGKSELRRLAIKALVDLSLSNPGKKGSKLGQQIPNAEFILESFGNARTIHNANASRLGKYTELQFTDRGRLAGAKTLDYYLERSRVAGPSPGERNFHVFYYLVSGASAEERAHLQLSGDSSAYRLLGARSGLLAKGAGGAQDDAVRFEQLKQAFKLVGLSKRLVAQICQLVAAILHIGNLEFVVDHDKNSDAAVVKNWDVLETVGEFLGVNPIDLEGVFNCKTTIISKEVCTVFLDPEGASANRDDLAKSLYGLLFAWLNEHINERLCRDDFANFVGILDLPGCQNLAGGFGARTNSLDQFCVNFANERLQNWILQSVHERQTAEFAAEDLASVVPTVPFFDNSECVRMLSTQPGGLIHIMDDQTKKMGKKTDFTMAEAFAKRWGNHGSFKASGEDRAGFPTFTVNHYGGPVTYSSESFLEKNSDAVNPDFVSLLRGAAGPGGAGAPNAGLDSTGSSNSFIKGLFSSNAIATQVHPRDADTVIAAQQPVRPMRAPSARRKGGRGPRLATLGEDGDEAADEERIDGRSSTPEIRCVVGEFKSALDVLFETFDETKAWFVFCLNPNDVQLPNQLESRGLKSQVRSFGLPEIAKKVAASFEVSMTHTEFSDRYAAELENVQVGTLVETIRSLREARGWPEKELAIGKYKVFVGYTAFRFLEDRLRSNDAEDQKRNREDAEAKLAAAAARNAEDPFNPYRSTIYDSSPFRDNANDSTPSFGAFADSTAALPLVSHGRGHGNGSRERDAESEYDRKTTDFDGQSRFTSHYEDTASNMGSESYAPSRNMFGNMEKPGYAEKEAVTDTQAHEGETVEALKISSARKKWVFLVWVLTWWVPGPFLKWFGGMKRPDVRQAWREKLAINLIIWFVCGCAVFVVAILGNLICPKQYVFSQGEISQQSYENNPEKEYVSIRGEVFDLTSIAKVHLNIVPIVKTKSVLAYGGQDATPLFPVQVSALCDGIDGTVSPWLQINSVNSTASRDVNSVYHDFRAYTNDSRPDWYYEQMVWMRYNYRLGFVGILPKTIKSSAAAGKVIAVYDSHIYDVSSYITSPPYFRTPDGTQAETGTTRDFMSPEIISLFQQSAGKDITKSLNALGATIGEDVLARQLTCLRNLFLIGMVDNRQSTQCQFATYILLALSIVMVVIIGFKFLGAIHFSAKKAPEDHDKFIVCQVPCYTEGEESLKRTIDSLARLKYDDKRKLLAIICDGMIVGSGNDRPTPRIVLDILGVDPNLDPEPLSFLSLGEGQKQHNMGKVYAGLYECAGHVVPYVVLVKIGKPSERHRPGNRGKRDSQMLLMHFFNKVHFGTPMNPFELEMFHQIKNVIGVNPSFYEYLFTIDADTTCDQYAINYLISAMMHDKKVIACCGETSIANAKQSLTTMMQVYEYYISHHLAKSFESLFGSVTCLPGCFTLYRLRTPDTHKPLFISDQIILDYSENRVDTLHLKNLLHLGEDRYLTTLLLKHFPTYKTTFVRSALAQTVAPDEWRVLLSQRRRWINSTVHNLAELVFIDKLCGFCCFSMRFVVFVDLLSTVIAPVTVAYLVYLIYLVAAEGDTIPTTSIVMLAAIYGLQMLVFLFRAKWDMIGWMIFYLLAIPIFSFYLPLYSFWKMDDFSWGNTRVVVGEKGKKLVIHDEGKFDPQIIPLKSWNDYENELWDKESNHSVGSWVPPSRKFNGGDSRAQSLYGRQTLYDAPITRGMSPSPSGYYDRKSNYSPSQAGGGGNQRYSNYPQSRIGEYPPPARVDSPQSQYRDGGGPPQSQHGDFYDRAPSMYQVPYGQNSTHMHSPYGGGITQSLLPSVPSSQPLGVRDPPTDEELEASVQRILSGSDLNQVTKKGVRKELEREWGVELSSRKEAINRFIEDALTNV